MLVSLLIMIIPSHFCVPMWWYSELVPTLHNKMEDLSEKKNRHLHIVQSLLLECSVPTQFWSEALSMAVHLTNCIRSPHIDDHTPYFLLFNKPPSYSHFHTFGCVYFVLLLPPL